MKLKIPEIKTREDYYRALFGTPKPEEDEVSPVVDRLKAEATKREKDWEGKFRIEELDDRYRFHNLEYHDGIYTVDWSKDLLDGGVGHTQEDWMTRTADTEFQVPNALLYHATIAALYNNQDHPVAEQQDLVQAVRAVFQKDFVNNYMMTSTRVKSAGKKKGLLRKKQSDVITHDWNTPTARTTKGSFVGSDGYVKPGCGFDTMIEALLGTDDFALVEEAYEWIGEQSKKPYLYRINNQPDNDIERVVVLGVDGSDRFGIDDDGVDVNYRPVRGVVTQRKKILYEK